MRFIERMLYWPFRRRQGQAMHGYFECLPDWFQAFLTCRVCGQRLRPVAGMWRCQCRRFQLTHALLELIFRCRLSRPGVWARVTAAQMIDGLVADESRVG
jgi:hypothetical protein